MKKLLITLIGICFCITIVAQKTKYPQFCATVDNMSPQSYPSQVMSTNEFSLTVEGDSADVYLPYIGEVYMPVYNDDGLRFSEPIANVNISRTKKDDGTIMSFSLKHDIVDYRFHITLYDNNNFDLFMQPSNCQSCSYGGEWEGLNKEEEKQEGKNTKKEKDNKTTKNKNNKKIE